jgi:hypothetical protein
MESCDDDIDAPGFLDLLSAAISAKETELRPTSPVKDTLLEDMDLDAALTLLDSDHVATEISNWSPTKEATAPQATDVLFAPATPKKTVTAAQVVVNTEEHIVAFTKSLIIGAPGVDRIATRHGIETEDRLVVPDIGVQPNTAILISGTDTGGVSVTLLTGKSERVATLMGVSVDAAVTFTLSDDTETVTISVRSI